MKQKITIIVLLFILFNIAAKGQIGKSNNHLNWHKIETAHFEVFFTSLWQPEAEKVARNLEELYQKDQILGKKRFGKTQIILQGSTIQSNGFVGFAPFRSEFYLMAPQNPFLNSGNWLDLLSIHEYHHVLQHHKIKSGIVQISNFVFGEYGQAVSANLLVPKWFWEGDAVYAETKLSHGGRGRSADFLKYYRAIATENTPFNIRRAIGGTINKYTPNHYNLGYLLTNQIRKENGIEIFSSILHSTTNKLKSFTGAIKDNTGNGLSEHFETALSSIRKEENAKKKWTNPDLIPSSKSNFYTEQLSIIRDQKEVFYISKDFKHLPSIRAFTDAKSLTQPGISLDNAHHFDINEDYICWTEYRKHPRWILEDYSIVRLKNRNTGKTSTLQKKVKHFQPQLHPFKNQIALLSANERNEMSIEVWNIDTKEIVQSIALSFDHAREMFFNQDGSILTLVVSEGQKQGVLAVDLRNKQQSLLIPLQYEAINSPKLFDYELLFLGNHLTDQHIYKLDLKEKSLYKSNNKFLHCQSFTKSPTNGDFIYNEFSTQGYSIKQIEKEALNASFEISHEFQEIDKTPIFQSTIPAHTISKVKSYFPKYKVHSYLPFATFNQDGIEQVGATLFINDKLSISNIELTVKSNLQTKDNRFSIDYVYGYFPIAFGANLQEDVSNVQHTQIEDIEKFNLVSVKEKRLSGFLSYPISTIKGNYSTQFNPRIGYLTKSIQIPNFSDRVNSYFYKHEFALSKRKAPAQALANIQYSQVLRVEQGKNKTNDLHMLALSNELTLPGIIPTHSTKLAYNYRNHSASGYLYNWDINLPYGYFYNQDYIGTAINSNEMHFYGINYQLPLAYPNVSLGKVAYIKRLRIEPFHQAVQFQLLDNSERTFSSTGCHFYLDANWFQLQNAGLKLTISSTPESEKSNVFIGFGIELLL